MAEKVSVLAFEKKLVPSDGRMYGTTWNKRNEQATPLALIEKSVRGTISNRPNKKDKAAFEIDPAKLDAKVENPNLQTVDVSSLGTEQDTLKLHYTLKILGGVEQDYISREGFGELAKRYAMNIANARFLWRNRVGAENIEVHVNALNKGSEQSWVFDSTKFSTREFKFDDEQVETLAQRIATALSSENDFLMLEITCFAKVGKAQEIYPSEELVLDKGKGKKSKVLYSVDSIAAMHSQKIGNALRTIDTWYPDFGDPENSAGPIAIEPYGAVTNLGKAFRHPTKDKKDFYTFFDKFARGGKLGRIEDEHYVMAVLVRGGVFGESDK
jgi:CRISPR-associated protein Csy3